MNKGANEGVNEGVKKSERMNCAEFRRLCAEQHANDEARWELHLLSCTSCAAYYTDLQLRSLSRAEEQSLQSRILAQTSSRRDHVDEQLRALHSVEPPPELLAAVLRQTTLMPAPHAVPTKTSWLSPIERILRRPRIALEASFVLTLAWMLTFGIPTDLVVSVASAEQQIQQPIENSRRQLAEFQTELQEGVSAFVKERLQRDPQGDQP